MEKIDYRLPDWNEIEVLAKKASDKIKADNFRPDLIIALSRGGLVPGRLFCDYLHVKNCLSIKVDHWGLTATKDGQAKLTQGLNTDLKGKKVLVVDDITDTGQSMELAINHLKTFNPEIIKTATLIHLKGSKYTPDFYGDEQGWAWVIFPWNYREDMVNIINKITKEKKMTDTELHELLNNEHKIPVEHEELVDILKHITYLNGN